MVRKAGVLVMMALLFAATPCAMKSIAGEDVQAKQRKEQVVRYLDISSPDLPLTDRCVGTQMCTLDCEWYILHVVGIPNECYCFATTGWSMDITCPSYCPDRVVFCEAWPD